MPGPLVRHHPHVHPYVTNLWGPSPGFPAAPIWDVDALAADGVRIVHLHFGFEQRTAAELSTWIEQLRRRRIALVHTVHDLDNPHLVDQDGFHRGVGVLVDASDAVTTLTPAAATVILRRHGRESTVIAHPHVVALAEMSARRHRWARRRGVYVHVATGRPNLDLAVVDALVAGADRPVHVHCRTTAPPDTLGHLRRLACRRHIHLDVDERPSDGRLWDRLGGAELVVLPYRWGTHSGLLEAATDLGTPVLAPRFGGYGDQGAHTYAPDDDAEALAERVAAAVARPPTLTANDRRTARNVARVAFATVYAEALAAQS